MSPIAFVVSLCVCRTKILFIEENILSNRWAFGNFRPRQIRLSLSFNSKDRQTKSLRYCLLADRMDISSSRNKTNYWQRQQDVNPSNKNQIKVKIVELNFTKKNWFDFQDKCRSTIVISFRWKSVFFCFVFFIVNCCWFADVPFYGENNQFKRSLSGTDQRGSPFKKRNFSQTITPPTHTGLCFEIDFVGRKFEI